MQLHGSCVSARDLPRNFSVSERGLRRREREARESRGGGVKSGTRLLWPLARLTLSFGCFYAGPQEENWVSREQVEVWETGGHSIYDAAGFVNLFLANC